MERKMLKNAEKCSPAIPTLFSFDVISNFSL